MMAGMDEQARRTRPQTEESEETFDMGLLGIFTRKQLEEVAGRIQEAFTRRREGDV